MQTFALICTLNKALCLQDNDKMQKYEIQTYDK